MSPSQSPWKVPIKDRGLLLAILLVTIGGAAAEFLHFRVRAREPVRTDGRVAIPEGDLTVRRVVHWDAPAGVLSSTRTKDRETGPTVDATGTVLVYAVGEPGADTELWMAERFQGATGPVWRRRRLTELSSRWDESGPCLTSDGRRLYFASNRSGSHGGFDLYVAAREGNRFLTPVNLGPTVNSAGDDFDPALAPDGRRLVFASNRSGPGSVPPSLYESRKTDGGWSSPVRVTALSSTRRDVAPAFGPEGKALYFASDRAGGAGGLDLYRSLEFDGQWLPPEPVAGLNTEADETDPALSGEGFSLYFTSGPGDLVVAHTRELYRWESESGRLLSAFGSLVLALLILLLAVYLARRWAEMGLLGRSVFASLIAHALLFLILGRVMVRGGVSAFEARPDRYRIALLPPRATARPGDRAFERVRGDHLSAPRTASAPAPQRAALSTPTPRIEARTLARGRAAEDRPVLDALRPKRVDSRTPPRTESLAPPPESPRQRRAVPMNAETAPVRLRLLASARAETPRSPDRVQLPAPAAIVAPPLLSSGRLESVSDPIETTVAAPRLPAQPANTEPEKRAERPVLARPERDPRRVRTAPRPRIAETASPLEVTRSPRSARPAREAPLAAAEPPIPRALPRRDSSLLEAARAPTSSAETRLSGFDSPAPAAATNSRPADRVSLARPRGAPGAGAGARRAVPAPVAREATEVRPVPDREVPKPERVTDRALVSGRIERDAGPGRRLRNRSAPAPTSGLDLAPPRLGAQPARTEPEKRAERAVLARPERDPRRVRTAPRSRIAETASPVAVARTPRSAQPVQEGIIAASEPPIPRALPRRDSSLLEPARAPTSRAETRLSGFDPAVPEAAPTSRPPDRVSLALPGGTPADGASARRAVPAPVARDAAEVRPVPELEAPKPRRATDRLLVSGGIERDPGSGRLSMNRFASAATPELDVTAPRPPDPVRSESRTRREREDPLRHPGLNHRPEPAQQATSPGGRDRVDPRAQPTVASRRAPRAAALTAIVPDDSPVEPEPSTTPSLLRPVAPDEQPPLDASHPVRWPTARTLRRTREPAPLQLAPSPTRADRVRRSFPARVDGEATPLAAAPRIAPAVVRRPVPLPEPVLEAPSHPMLRCLESRVLDRAPALRGPHPTSAERESSLYAHRTGEARLRALREHGGTAESERAVQRGLEYLARIQRSDGSWGNPSYRHDKYGQVQVGKTGLALLAFLGSGHTQISKTRFSAAVKRAIGFLLEAQNARNGHFGSGSAYSHGIATYALAEAHAMTKDPELRDPLRRAVNRILEAQIVDAQNHLIHGGWSYYYADENRTWDAWPRASVTAWQVMALKSAQIGGIRVPGEAISAARGYLRRSFDREYGYFRYAHDPDRLRSTYRTLPGSTPASMFALLLLGEDPASERIVEGRRFVMERLPRRYARASDERFVTRAEGNIYFWYYATLALFTLRGEAWDAWNNRLRDLLVKAQQQDGSWTPISPYANYANDTRTDRSYTTALSVLILEVYYRYVTPLLLYRPKTTEREEAPVAESGPPVRLRVVAIRARSTATRVGLKIGDEIVRYAGKRVTGTDHLRALIHQHRESDAVALDVVRRGRTLRLTVPGGLLGVTVEE